MSEPRSVRFEPSTVARLSAFTARRPGLTSSSAAALLVEEGLRMDAHPGVVFREGPSGRRAAIAGGPDVWEVVRAIRDTRTAEPRLRPGKVLDRVSANTGVSVTVLHVAVQYYAAFPDEIDAQVADADAAEADAEKALARTRKLLEA
jgi:hypothetical protein